MRKDEYTALPPYLRKEHRHVISLRSCSNIEIVGLTVKDSGGDGVFGDLGMLVAWLRQSVYELRQENVTLKAELAAIKEHVGME